MKQEICDNANQLLVGSSQKFHRIFTCGRAVCIFQIYFVLFLSLNTCYRLLILIQVSNLRNYTRSLSATSYIIKSNQLYSQIFQSDHFPVTPPLTQVTLFSCRLLQKQPCPLCLLIQFIFYIAKQIIKIVCSKLSDDCCFISLIYYAGPLTPPITH